MTELAVINYLRGFDDGNRALAQLNEEYGIEAKQHPNYPELYQFNYSQVDSPKTHPIVRDCRGLILNREADWQVVALPFRRFFNYGEAECEKEIDWPTAKVQDKADGSLIICYFYKGRWHVATRGNPKGNSPVAGFNTTFGELFRQAVAADGIFDHLDTDCTYLFELCSPYNRVVVSHAETHVIGLASFDTKTYQEIQRPDYNPVSQFHLSSIDDLLAIARELNPLDQEGYVVVDDKGNRLKIKSPKYVALHHLISSMSQRKMIELVRHGDTEEVLSYYPELREEHDKIKSRLDDLIEEAKQVWEANKDLLDKKSFALQIKDHPLASVLFGLRDGKVNTVREGVQTLNLKKLERLLNLGKDKLANYANG